MRSVAKVFFLVCLGFFSFTFFFYLSFPYEVLKEVVASNASEATGLNVNIGGMRPRLPLGIEVSKVSLATPNGQTIEIANVGANLKVLDLLLGRIGFDLELTDNQRGYLEANASFSAFDLMTGGATMPRSIWLDAQKFNIGTILNFVLENQAKDQDTNVMVKPLLNAFEVEAKLNAKVDFSIDSNNLANSEGTAQFNFINAALIISDKNLTDLPNQEFEKALVEATFKNGRLLVDDKSSLISKDLHIGLSGEIIQKPQIEKTQFNLKVGVELREALKSQFTWILNAAAKKETDGKIEIQITGSLTPGPRVKIL